MRNLVVGIALGAACGAAHAQADVGLVNLVSGEVVLTANSAKPTKPSAFMKVREGDRFDVAAGAQVRVVYFQGARQERWQGPASFRAARTQSTPITGGPAEVVALPANVSQRIARVPELMQNARLGGIQVRSAQPARRVEGNALVEARATYERLRKDLPRDDITPELFLYSTLNEYQLYEEMAPVVEEMQRKQPDSEDVKLLASWLKTRRGR